MHRAFQAYTNPIRDNNQALLLNNVLENVKVHNNIYAHDNLEIFIIFWAKWIMLVLLESCREGLCHLNKRHFLKKLSFITVSFKGIRKPLDVKREWIFGITHIGAWVHDHSPLTWCFFFISRKVNSFPITIPKAVQDAALQKQQLFCALAVSCL